MTRKRHKFNGPKALDAPASPMLASHRTGPAPPGRFVMSGFAINLGTLPLGVSRVRLEEEPPALDLKVEDWVDRIVGEFDLDRVADRVSVRGRLAATARLDCVRCLRRFERPVETPFEIYADRAGSGHRAEEEALERDDYMKFHDGRTLNLGEEVREALLLELPMAPHCREDCRGLCPRCGSDLNEAPCACGGAR